MRILEQEGTYEYFTHGREQLINGRNVVYV